MDIATIVGIVGGIFFVMHFGIGWDQGALFVDVPSIAIVVGGTVSAMFIAYPLTTLTNISSVLKNVFTNKSPDFVGTIKQIVDFAEQARREGILCLEARSQEVKDEFLKKGIQLAVDGTEPSLIRDIMQADIDAIDERHSKGSGMMADLSSMAPAWGMIGTLVGLVIMLVNMSDPSSLGPAMAVALITTFYGSVIANFFFTPFEMKLKKLNAAEMQLKKIMLEGIMSLQSGDNPKVVQWKLESYVDPDIKLKLQKK